MCLLNPTVTRAVCRCSLIAHSHTIRVIIKVPATRVTWYLLHVHVHTLTHSSVAAATSLVVYSTYRVRRYVASHQPSAFIQRSDQCWPLTLESVRAMTVDTTDSNLPCVTVRSATRSTLTYDKSLTAAVSSDRSSETMGARIYAMGTVDG